MVKTRLIPTLALGLSIGCGSGSAGGSGGIAGASDAGPLPPNVVEVDATDGDVFSPSRLTVVAGTTVRWVNKGRIEHTVTSGASSKRADSPGAAFDAEISRGEIFERTFTEVGVQPYFCRYHEAMGMVGTVTVTAAP